MGRISDADIAHIRETADLVAIAGRYTKLKGAGGRGRFMGRCPFHDEKTGSFSVGPQPGMWHCFGCSKGGNTVDFVMEIGGYGFREAVEWLAKEIGYELTDVDGDDPEAQAAERRRYAVRNAIGDAAELYHQRLRTADPLATHVVEYLHSRGFTDETIDRFGFGFAPPAGGLAAKLAAGDHTLEALVGAGLTYQPRNSAEQLTDAYRGRVIIPIHSVTGKVVALAGRILDAHADVADRPQAKYVNSSDEVFAKGRHLYGAHLAAETTTKTNTAIVVEGYMDVAALHQAGHTNTVATCGTALTEDHARWLTRRAERVILLFDADGGGAGAVEKGYRELITKGLLPEVATLPDGLDPADLAAHDPGRLADVLGDTVDALTWIVRRHRDAGGDTPDSRASAAKIAIGLIDVADPLTRTRLISRAADAAGVDAGVIGSQVDLTAPAAPPAPVTPSGTADPAEHARKELERDTLWVLLNYEHAESLAREITVDDFTNPTAAELARVILANPGSDLDTLARLLHETPRPGSTVAPPAALRAVAAGPEPRGGVDITWVNRVVATFAEARARRSADELRLQLQTADPARRDDLVRQMFDAAKID